MLFLTVPTSKEDLVKMVIERGILFIIAIAAIGLAGFWAFTKIYRMYKKAKVDPVATQVRIIERPRCSICTLDQSRGPEDLAKHSLFSTIDFLMVAVIPRLPVRELGRQLIFRDFLEIKIRCVKAGFQTWMMQHLDEIVEMDQDKLRNDLMTVITDIVRNYESEATRVQIPQIAIARFREWHSPRMDLLQREVDMVMTSDWISTNVERIGYLFTVIEQIIRGTLLDAEGTLHALNGELTGQVYRGVMVGPCIKR